MMPIISKKRLTSSITTVIAVMSTGLLGACKPIEGRWSATNYGYNDIRISGTSGLEQQTTSILPIPQVTRTGIPHPAASVQAFPLTASLKPAPSSSKSPTARTGALEPNAPRSITASGTVPISKTNFRPNPAIVSRSVGDITRPHLATQNVSVLQKTTSAPTASPALTRQTQSTPPTLFESIGKSVSELLGLVNINQYNMSSPALNNQQSNIHEFVGSNTAFKQ